MIQKLWFQRIDSAYFIDDCLRREMIQFSNASFWPRNYSIGNHVWMLRYKLEKYHFLVERERKKCCKLHGGVRLILSHAVVQNAHEHSPVSFSLNGTSNACCIKHQHLCSETFHHSKWYDSHGWWCRLARKIGIIILVSRGSVELRQS